MSHQKAVPSHTYLKDTHEGIQGRSPAGLERCSHIAEVIGSSPIVPTPYTHLNIKEKEMSRKDVSFFLYWYRALIGVFLFKHE